MPSSLSRRLRPSRPPKLYLRYAKPLYSTRDLTLAATATVTPLEAGPAPGYMGGDPHYGDATIQVLPQLLALIFALVPYDTSPRYFSSGPFPLAPLDLSLIVMLQLNHCLRLGDPCSCGAQSEAPHADHNATSGGRILAWPFLDVPLPTRHHRCVRQNRSEFDLSDGILFWPSTL